MSIYEFINTSTATFDFVDIAVSNLKSKILKSDDNCNDCDCDCDCQSRCDCQPNDCDCMNTECNCDCDCDCKGYDD